MSLRSTISFYAVEIRSSDGDECKDVAPQSPADTDLRFGGA
jgi:hypothetical protein